MGGYKLRTLVLAKTFEYDKTIVYIDLIQFAKNKLSYRILYLLLIQVMISTRSSTINYKRWVILVCVVNQNLAVVIVVNKTLIILLLLLISWDLTVCVVLARHRGCVCNRRTNDLKSNWYMYFFHQLFKTRMNFQIIQELKCFAECTHYGLYVSNDFYYRLKFKKNATSRVCTKNWSNYLKKLQKKRYQLHKQIFRN